MNKLIKQHCDQFNDIKGSKKLETQFLQCPQHPSHIDRCISNIKIYLNPTSISKRNSNLTLV